MSNCLVLFVTHYHQITLLGNMYAGIANMHFKTAVHFVRQHGNEDMGNNDELQSHLEIEYLHQLHFGPCDLQNGYGVIMSQLHSFPPEVIQDAKAFRSFIFENYGLTMKFREADDTNSFRVVQSLKHYLQQLKAFDQNQDGLNDASEDTVQKEEIVGLIRDLVEENNSLLND